MAEDPNILLYLDMKIEDNVKEIKDYALRNKQLLRNFLEGFKIDNMAINDYITYHMLNNLENLENPNYTYWMDTGLTWSLWYNGGRRHCQLPTWQVQLHQMERCIWQFLYFWRWKIYWLCQPK